MERLHCQAEQREKYTSRIVLNFLRHGEKKIDSSKSDMDIELTARGKQQVIKKSGLIKINQAVAFGSPRVRAQESAAFAMTGQQVTITGTESLDELRKKLDRELSLGSKIGIDGRLDFILESNTPFGKKEYEAFEKKRLLKFLVEESDRLAIELDDKDSSTYSRMASAVASIIDKYVSIAPRWDALVKDENKKYTDTLERFFGTHQGILESFLGKVIEITKGKKELGKFLEAVGDQGFDYAEGFRAEIDTINNMAQLRILYKKENDNELLFEYNEIISMELLKKLIE